MQNCFAPQNQLFYYLFMQFYLKRDKYSQMIVNTMIKYNSIHIFMQIKSIFLFLTQKNLKLRCEIFYLDSKYKCDTSYSLFFLLMRIKISVGDALAIPLIG